jgi:hypothetical protein
MNIRSKALSQPDADARQRREARESKPVREWTVEERREAFTEARRIEREKSEAGIMDEVELCESCWDNPRAAHSFWCTRCIEGARQYLD